MIVEQDMSAPGVQWTKVLQEHTDLCKREHSRRDVGVKEHSDSPARTFEDVSPLLCKCLDISHNGCVTVRSWISSPEAARHQQGSVELKTLRARFAARHQQGSAETKLTTMQAYSLSGRCSQRLLPLHGKSCGKWCVHSVCPHATLQRYAQSGARAKRSGTGQTE